MFPKETYIARRKTLLEKMSLSAPEGKRGIALFLGNVEAAAQYKDNAYKFRQDSSWLYYFGIDEPRFAAVIDLDGGEETLFADDVEIGDIIAALLDIPEGKLEAKASEALIKAVISMRLVKEECEIAQLDDAGALGQEMHTVGRENIRLGIVEQEIVGKMEACTLAKGWGVSFATILTQHGEILHNHGHDNIVEPGRLMVIDAGAENNMHYASDYTRTYPTSGKFTPKQKEIYQIVCDCNELAFSLTKPGIAYRDVHIATARLMLEELKSLDIVRGDVDAMVEAGIAGLFQPHGLGHNMGLDVHDMEDLGEDLVGYDSDQKRSKQLGLGSLRMARRLVPGHVVTDEPGIYFIPALIAKWKAEKTDNGFVNYAKLEKEYLDFGGIRLEDDVLVTADGARRLGPGRLPILPDDVEWA